jgi:hypothetical protein
MGRGLSWLLGVLLVLAVGYGVVRALIPGARAAAPPAAGRSQLSEGEDLQRAESGPGDHDTMVVTIEIPAAADVPTGGAHGGRCPKDQMGNVLGVTLSQAHGLVVATVLTDGPADRAGIEPGDWLGNAQDCPSSTLPSLRAQHEPRSIEWTVRRPKTGDDKSPEPESPTEEPVSP